MPVLVVLGLDEAYDTASLTLQVHVVDFTDLVVTVLIDLARLLPTTTLSLRADIQERGRGGIRERDAAWNPRARRSLDHV